MTRFYNFLIARILGKKLDLSKEAYLSAPEHFKFEVEKAINCTTVEQFDRSITIKVYGYPTVDTYYRKFGSVNQILNVKVPLFCLSSKDDPITSVHAVPKYECIENENTILMITDRGSHIGWVEGNFKL
jgi:predicted alpha/beta-fold hydrolase